jgi:outer membrane protein
MKKNILSLFLLVTFSLNVFAELKVGFVRVDEILKNAPQAAESNKKLEAEFKTRTAKLKKDIEALNKNEQQFKKDSLTIPDDEKEKKQRKLQNSRIDIQRTERELREDIDIRRRDEINQLQVKITEVIEKLAERDKFDLILYTGVAYASDKVNITDLVLKELSK